MLRRANVESRERGRFHDGYYCGYTRLYVYGGGGGGHEIVPDARVGVYIYIKFYTARTLCWESFELVAGWSEDTFPPKAPTYQGVRLLGAISIVKNLSERAAENAAESRAGALD